MRDERGPEAPRSPSETCSEQGALVVFGTTRRTPSCGRPRREPAVPCGAGQTRGLASPGPSPQVTRGFGLKCLSPRVRQFWKPFPSRRRASASDPHRPRSSALRFSSEQVALHALRTGGLSQGLGRPPDGAGSRPREGGGHRGPLLQSFLTPMHRAADTRPKPVPPPLTVMGQRRTRGERPPVRAPPALQPGLCVSSSRVPATPFPAGGAEAGGA